MKKGFTLIELLAVIVILAIIALIATPIVLNIINDTKKSAMLRSAEFYIDAVENEIMLENMKQGGSFNPNICNIDNDGNVLCDDYDTIEIKVDGEKPNGGSITFDNGKVTDVTLTFKDKTVSMNSKGELVFGELVPVCKLIDGESNAIGSKYQCKVKDNMEEGFEDGYYFFVLSNNEDGTTNLIMDTNISKYGVNWSGGSEDHTHGPVSAMIYLYNATKDWVNVPNIIINYIDENIDKDTKQKGSTGYGSIKTVNNITTITKKDGTTTKTIENLKARMPRYDEVTGVGKCTTINGSCPSWLFSENYGYWTLSSAHSNIYDYGPSDAWAVSDSVGIEYTGDDMTTGVRPVITIKL